MTQIRMDLTTSSPGVSRLASRVSRLASGLAASLALAATLALALSPAPLAAQDRAARETQVVKVVRKVSPAVVYVSCQQRVQNPFAGSVWDMFGGVPGFQGDQEENSLGSGVLVESSGYVLTNEHVVLGGSKIQVTLSSGKQYAARVVGTAPESDLALLKIDAERPLPTAELGTSSDLMIGETVIAVGNPFGLSNTVTVGILSATGRTVTSGNRQYSDFLQTDAAINPGNSGGALLNILGQVIGINTAIIRDAQGIGFAIPIDRAKRVMEQLRAYGRVRPMWLGFLALDLNDFARKRAGVAGGVYIAKTYPFAFPQVEALREGDIVTTMQGRPLDGTGDLNARLAMATAGQRVELSGIRHGERFTANLSAAALPEQLTPAMAWELLGLRVSEGQRGVVVSSVRRGSPAESTGLRAGDAVLAVEDEAVKSPADFLARARTALASTGLVVSVGRGSWTYYVTLNLLTDR
jgi:serine protease Do